MKFSLVIPVAPDRGTEIMQSLKNIDYPESDFQTIIVKGLNPSINRNNGAKDSEGEIIGFLDDDAVVESDFLKNVENFFDKHPKVDIAGGPQLTPKSDRGFARTSGYALCSKFGAWKLSSRYSKSRLNLNADEQLLTSANLFCRKKVLEKIKFDSKLFPGEDPKFIEDAKKAGFKIAYCPDFVIYHRRRANIRGLVKQIFNYGKVRPMKENFFETIKKPFFLIPSIFFAYIIFIALFAFANASITGAVINAKSNDLFLFFPLALYILIAVIFGFYDSLKNKDIKAVFALAFIYPIIHLSYGAGMIFGYFKKLRD